VHRYAPHELFWYVTKLTNGDPTLHAKKYKELLKTPYMWVLSYMENDAKQQYEYEKQMKRNKK
jgi:hypothetical protein